MSYELPETIADGTPLEPCGSAMYAVDGKFDLQGVQTAEQRADTPEYFKMMVQRGAGYEP